MLKGVLKGVLWCLRRVGTQRRGIPGVETDEEGVVVEEEGDLKAHPLVGTQLQAACLPEDEEGKIPPVRKRQ